MKRLALLIPLIFLLFTSQVSADPIFPFPDDCQDFDFSTGQHGWAIENSRGSYSAGVGFVATLVTAINPRQNIVQIGLEFDDVTITEIRFFYTYSQGQDNSSVADTRLVAYQNGGVVQDYQIDSTNATTENAIDNVSVVADKAVVRIYSSSKYSSPASSPSPLGSVTIHAASICIDEGTEPLVRPLSAQDEFTPWGLINQDWNGTVQQDKTVVNFAKQPGAPVAAAVDGEIIAIEQYDDNYKTRFIRPTFGPPIQVPEDLTSQVGDFDYEFPYSFKGTVWVVALYSEELDQYFVYFVADAPKYVEVGMEIRANCYLGESIPMSGTVISIDVGFTTDGISGGITGSVIDAEPAVTIVAVLEPGQDDWFISGGTIADSLEQFSIYPTTSNACNVDPENADCIGDSALQYPEYWDTYRSVSWTDPGVQLGPQAYIKTLDTRPLNLDPTRQPRLAISVRSTINPSSLRVGIGQTFETFSVTNVFKEYVIEGAEHEPTVGDTFYQIFVGNDSTNPNAVIQVEYICITFTYDEGGDPEPPPQPPSCYFANSTFDDGTGSWTVSGGVYTYDNRPGEILVQDGQTFQQNVVLNPVDGSTSKDYLITVETALFHIPSYVVSPTNTTSTVEVEYDYDSAGYVSMGTVTYATYANNNNVILFQDVLTVSADTDGPFIFRVQTTSQPSEVEAVSIRFGCIETDDGDGFPGYDDGEGTPDPEPPPFNADCEAIAPPAGDAVHHWIAWHWANLNAFFKCDLMIFLNQQYRTLQSFFKTVGYAIRYWIVMLNMGVDWLGDQFLPWLGGYLSNASGAATIYYGDGIGEDPEEGCEWWNLVCHAGNIIGGVGDFLSGAFDSLKDVLSFLFNNLLVPIMNALFDLLRELVDNILRPLLEALIDLLRRIVDFIFNTLVDFIKKAVSFIFNVLKGIVERVIQVAQFVIGKLIELLLTVKVLIEAIINVWNEAEPATLPGAPNCGVSTNNVMCWVYFVMENTFFSGTIGGLIIPIFAALAWILLGLSTLGQLLKLVRNAGQAV